MVPVPLFGALPGGPELLVIALVLLIPFSVGFLVYRDALSRGERGTIAALWAVVVAFGIMVYLVPGLVALVAYWWTTVREHDG